MLKTFLLNYQNLNLTIMLIQKLKRATTQIAPEIDNIRENKQSFDTLAILVIPPISICLSLFSIIFNILVLVAKWIHVLCKLKIFLEFFLLYLSFYLGVLFYFLLL